MLNDSDLASTDKKKRRLTIHAENRSNPTRMLETVTNEKNIGIVSNFFICIRASAQSHLTNFQCLV
jgi:hypothetical protein